MESNLKILAIDTSTKTGSVALTDDDRIIAETLLNIEVTHSETLLPAIENLFRKSGTSLGEIELLALTLGPGSFTGIRIGVSTMKGFAFALGKPVAGVSTLEAMAYNFPLARPEITPLLDARRGEIYSADFKWHKGGLERLSEDRALSPETILTRKRGKTIFVGDGLVRIGDRLKSSLGEKALFAPPSKSCIRGSIIADLALKKYDKGEILDPAAFTPAYLRRSEAEINREKRLLKSCSVNEREEIDNEK